MGLIEQGVGCAIGAKMAANDIQKVLIDNIYKYRTEKIDVKHAKRMVSISAFTFACPVFAILVTSVIIPDVTKLNDTQSTLFIAWILFCAVCIIIGVMFANYVNKKYAFHMAIQDPKKEKRYRWSNLVLYNDEIDEWADYVAKHPLSRPSGVIEPVILDRTSCKIVGNLNMKQVKELLHNKIRH